MEVVSGQVSEPADRRGGVTEAPARSDPRTAEAPVTPAALLAASRGFVLCLWGVATGVLAAAGAVQIGVADSLGFPSYLPGAFLCALGLFSMGTRPAGVLRAPARVWAPLFLIFYGAPFVQWWSERPYVAFYIVQVQFSVAAVLWLLIEMCAAGRRVSVVLRHSALAQECRWAALLIAGALVLLAGAGVAAALIAWRREVSLYAVWFSWIYAAPRVAPVLALMPFSLAMACAWRVHHLCRARLAALAAVGAGLADVRN